MVKVSAPVDTNPGGYFPVNVFACWGWVLS